MTDELRTWVSKGMADRHWSQRELARRSGVSQAFISRMLSEEIAADADACIKIALAFGELPEKPLRLAGILPPLPASNDPYLAELRALIESLPPSKRLVALEFMRFLHQSGKDKE